MSHSTLPSKHPQRSRSQRALGRRATDIYVVWPCAASIKTNHRRQVLEPPPAPSTCPQQVGKISDNSLCSADTNEVIIGHRSLRCLRQQRLQARRSRCANAQSGKWVPQSSEHRPPCEAQPQYLQSFPAATPDFSSVEAVHLGAYYPRAQNAQYNMTENNKIARCTDCWCRS
jgi:hypothetical protein